jgi:hypothetical protein
MLQPNYYFQPTQAAQIYQQQLQSLYQAGKQQPLTSTQMMYTVPMYNPTNSQNKYISSTHPVASVTAVLKTQSTDTSYDTANNQTSYINRRR